MPVRFRSFWIAFFLTLLAFFILNLLAAHFMSDCGLPAVLGMAGCSDDIVRAGFPLPFYEAGGFAYRYSFNLPLLLTDVLIGLGASFLAGALYHRRPAGNA